MGHGAGRGGLERTLSAQHRNVVTRDFELQVGERSRLPRGRAACRLTRSVDARGDAAACIQCLRDLSEGHDTIVVVKEPW